MEFILYIFFHIISYNIYWPGPIYRGCILYEIVVGKLACDDGRGTCVESRVGAGGAQRCNFGPKIDFDDFFRPNFSHNLAFFSLIFFLKFE